LSPKRNNWRFLVWGVVVLLASTLAAPAKKASLDELKEKLKSATRPDDKASLATQIAEAQVDAADKLFKQGKFEEGQQAVSEVASYTQQAHDAAIVTGRRLKNLEISVRKMAHRLTDIKRQLTFEEQAPVQAAVDQLEKIRTDLLNRMFKAGK
jgi:hypothetical protein